jgi:signal transduction histidine kinase/ligand-binding sensor domain-containing protein
MALAKTAWISLVGWLAVSSVMAAPGPRGWSFRNWQLEEGLPNNFVVGTARTADGYLWVATRMGLARFDGVRFEPVPTRDFFDAPIQGQRALTASRQGGFWLALDPGIVVHLNFDSYRVYTNSATDLVPSKLLEDRDGALWIMYRSGQLYRLKDGAWKEFGSADGLPEGAPCSLACDAQGQIWFARGRAVGVFRSGRFETLAQTRSRETVICSAPPDGIWVCSGPEVFRFHEGGQLEPVGTLHASHPNTSPTVMVQDQEGALWIGTYESGLYRFDGSEFERMPSSDRQIESITQESDGRFWVGTAGGLNLLAPQAIRIETEENGLPFAAVRSICEDTNGTLWAATENGELACRGSNGWSTAQRTAEWQKAFVSSVASDRDNALWLGTQSRRLYRWRNGSLDSWGSGEGLIGRWINTLLVSRSGEVWIAEEKPDALQCVRDGQVRTVPLPEGVRSIRAMAEDPAGTIWIGARTDSGKGMVLRVNHDTVTDESHQSMAPRRPIRCMYATADGSIWIGSPGEHGLVRLKQGRFSRITTDQGLSDTVISQIVADREWIWCAADHGLFRVRQEELDAVADGRLEHVHSVRYGKSEDLPGLQGLAYGSSGTLRDRSGLLWIPMRTGLAVVDPKRLREQPEPPVKIERVLVDQQPIAAYGGLAPVAGALDLRKHTTVLLPPTHRRLEIEFTALSFGSPENERFRYRLDGYDETWTEVGTPRRAVYPRLAAGDYRFRVIACNDEGVWNNRGETIAFTVAPLLWQTWWFRALTLAVFAALVTMLARYVSFRRLRQELHALELQAGLARERSRMARDLHDQFGTRLTELGLIAELAARKSSAEKGSSPAELLPVIRTLQEDLDTIVWAANPTNDSLPHLAQFICRMAGEFLGRCGIACRLDVADDLPNIPLNPELRHNLFLVAREAVNNIAKHSGARLARIRIAVDDGCFCLTFEDDGKGFSPAEAADGGRNGLRNMRGRVEESDGVFEIQCEPGRGTVVRIRVPLPDVISTRARRGETPH